MQSKSYALAGVQGGPAAGRVRDVERIWTAESECVGASVAPQAALYGNEEGPDEPVLRSGSELHGEFYGALGAFDGSQQHVRSEVAQVVASLVQPRCKGVGEGEGSCVCVEGGFENHGALQIASADAAGSAWRDGPVASMWAENSSE
jgi:hypothetical protein